MIAVRAAQEPHLAMGRAHLYQPATALANRPHFWIQVCQSACRR